MAKLAPTSIKYIIKATIKAKGVIEKPDVVGAIFGQTEGLLSSDLDLRELQKTGKLGRIEVNIKSKDGNSEGEIIVPSALDISETALIAASLETIDRIGPCTAEIQLTTVEDTRSTKREYIKNRAKDILKNIKTINEDSTTVISEIKDSIKTDEVSEYHGLSCGPELLDSEEIIIVEGRADVLNLLKMDIKNTIAIGGTSVPDLISEIAKGKTVTVFVDGDRGGQLILKELSQKIKVDYIATAPDGKEVEELTQKEVLKALKNKIKVEEPKTGTKREYKTYKKYDNKTNSKRTYNRSRTYIPVSSGNIKLNKKQKKLFKKTLDELVGTRAACIFDENNEILGKVPVTELSNTIRTLEKPFSVVFDGKVDHKLNLIARDKGINFLVGMEKEDIRTNIRILDKKDLE